MRTCPKEEETVETCDGMNQKKIIFDKSGLKKAEKLAKSKKKQINDYRNWYEKKIDISMCFLSFISCYNNVHSFYGKSAKKNFD